jgi:sec-independent protein translocase protein TatA
LGGALLSPTHVALLLLVVLLLFGAKRLPELGKSLGGSMRAFKDSIDGEESQRTLEASPTNERPTAGAAEQGPQVPAAR